MSALATDLLGRDDPEARAETLSWMDLCIRAFDNKDRPFLPLRGHLFQPTLTGLWACANSGCPGRAGTRLDDPSWPFGALFPERRRSCPHCRTPVFDLVQCDECGTEYLAAAEVHRDGLDWLDVEHYDQAEDEFQQELEPLNDEEDADGAVATWSAPRLLTARASATRQGWGVGPEGRLDPSGQTGVAVHLRFPGERGLEFALCRQPARAGALFRPVRVGAPFMLGTAIPALLEAMPQRASAAEPRPLDGRRLSTFTESRQGTARFAAKLQQEAERDSVRSFLYHQLAAVA